MLVHGMVTNIELQDQGLWDEIVISIKLTSEKKKDYAISNKLGFVS